MKKLLPFVVFLFAVQISFGQTRWISGKVLTADQQAAAGLLVSIQGANAVTYTKKDGTFKISATAGNRQLVIKSGLGNYDQSIEVTSDQDVVLPTIQLKEKSYELKEVIVTAQYGPQSLRNSVYNIRSISAEKIKLRAATNVQQVLNTEFGFRFSNDLTLGTTDVELMGMSGRNVKILLDGVPMVDRADTRESLNQIDINTVERIEVVEGPMSVIYGTDALAGVINIITKNAGKSLLNVVARVQDETAGNEYAALSGNGAHLQHVNASWQKNGWSAMAGVTHNEFGGWNLAPKLATAAEVNADPNRWKPKEQYLGNTKIGYRNANLNLWYRLDGMQETIDSRGGMNPSNYKAKFQTYTTHRYAQQMQTEWRANENFQFTALAGYTHLQRATRSVIHDFTNNNEELTTGAGEQDVAKFNAAIFRATGLYTISKAIAVQPGIEFNRDAATGARIKGTPVINDYAFFVSSELKPISTIQIRPGVRLIKNTVYDAPAFIPSLNTKFALSKALDLRLAYARGFRAPALRELYYDFFDASHSIMGNENLKAEESNSFNGSLAWAALQDKKIQFRSTLAGFYNLFKNRIDYGQDPNNSSITTLINISRYKTTGVSIDNNLIYQHLQVNIGLSYIGRYNSLLESNQSLAIPDFAWTPEISSNLSYTFTKLNANISLFYKYTGARPGYQLDPAATVPTARVVKVGAFSWADLLLAKNLYKYLTINAGVKNLFNVTQLSNSSVATGGAHSTGGASIPYSYGRSYVLGITFNWNKN